MINKDGIFTEFGKQKLEECKQEYYMRETQKEIFLELLEELKTKVENNQVDVLYKNKNKLMDLEDHNKFTGEVVYKFTVFEPSIKEG